MGVPFNRIQQWQAMHGIPLASSTQWDKVKELWNKLRPICQLLHQLSAESQLTYFDDTGNRILMKDSLVGRKGIYTTAMVSEVDGHSVYLYMTANQHAGENLKRTLSSRETDEALITMCDASSNNIPSGMNEELVARWIFCFCLVHGRRKFYEIFDFFEQECGFVLEVLGRVYQNDSHCKQHQLTPQERLDYHQEHSLGQLEALKNWLNNQLLFKATEPNSNLGQAIQYMLKHWKGLTQFCHHVGVPLDNSLCERAIKVVIRHRRNSLFYRTLQGANVGDDLMSLIQTAKQNGVDAFDYLNQLQIYQSEVEANPPDWLPWRYQETISRLQAANAA